MRRPSFASCIPMPSPIPPCPFRVWWASSFIFRDCAGSLGGMSYATMAPSQKESAMQKVAPVTGAGSGIGKSAALALLKAGWQVGLVGRRKDMLDKTASESGAKDRALVLAADITKDAEVEKVFAELKSKFGRLDVLFNNAGMGAPAVPMEDLPIEKFREVVNINLVAMFMCTQHAIRIMKAQDPKGGRIINNGSISAHAPRPMSVAYTSTKHAVTGLTKCISLDGRKNDITASQIDI